MFGELQDALDRIWRAPARERSAGWWNLLRARLLSFGMILGIAFLLMVVAGAQRGDRRRSASGGTAASRGWETLAQIVNLAGRLPR